MSLGFKKFLIILAVVAPLISFAVAPVRVYAAEAHSSKDTLVESVSCGWNLLAPGCIAQGVYYFLFKPVNYFLLGAGYIFDAILAMSINRDFINKDFVRDIWVVIRDFSNMIFIFILLYTGIQTMFGIGNWKATVLKVVVLALIVNFSLFFTKVVIDAGNILAVGVYQGIGTEKVKGGNDPMYTKATNTTTGKANVKERNISGSFANSFKPQKFLSQVSKNSTDATTIFLIATVVNLAAAIVLLRAALIFMGRIIAFWFLMIISPFALVSMALPKGNIFNDWLSSLLNQAFVAPLFLFLLYIIMTAMNISGGIIGDTIDEKSTGAASFMFDSIFVPIVIAGMIIYALNYTVKIAKNLSDDFGNLGAKALTTVLSAAPVGMAANVALGGGAGILRATVGQGAGKLLQSGGLNKMTTSSGITGLIGRGLYGATEKAHKGTFDVRNTKVAEYGLGALKAEGVGINLGQADKSGWDKIQKQREKDAKARAGKHEVSDAEKATKAGEINPQYAKAKADEEYRYQAERAATLGHAKAKESANNTDEGKRVTEGKVVKAETEAKQKVAKERADNSPAGKSVKDAENSLKTMGSTAKTEGDRLVKAIERLKKDQAEAVKNGALGTAERLEGEIAQAKKDEENAQKLADGAIKNAERELEDAKKAFDDSDEGKALVGANKDLVDVGQKLEDAQKALDKTAEGMALKVAEGKLNSASATLNATRKIIKETDDEVKEWANSENERRREQIGRVETRGRFYYTNADRESSVKTVRAAKTKDQRSEDKEEKKALKLVRKAMKEATKEEEGDGKESEKKEEKPAEEGGEKK